MTVADLRGLDLSASITANDLERSIRFYTEGLGFAVDQRIESEGRLRGVTLRAGLITLALSQDDFARGRDRSKGIGLGLHLVTEQNLGDVVERLTAAGFSVDREPAPLPWAPLGFQVYDPDGFLLTIANPE